MSNKTIADTIFEAHNAGQTGESAVLNILSTAVGVSTGLAKINPVYIPGLLAGSYSGVVVVFGADGQLQTAPGSATISVNATNNTIPSRGAGGIINVGTPTSNSHATTKLYVDNATRLKTQTVALTALPTAGTSTVAEIEAKINAIIAALKA